MAEPRSLKIVPRENVLWQEAFPLGRGRCICPYCGSEIRIGKPWGVCQSAKERAMPRSMLPGNTIHKCPVCRLSYLYPKKKVA